MPPPSLGAEVTPAGTRFAVWSTRARQVAVTLTGAGGRLPLSAEGDGLFTGTFAEVGPGALYKVVLDGRELPDPYARSLPEGVHGPAEVLALDHPWRYATRRTPIGSGLVIYELHVGTFTSAGTYAAAAARLGELAGLGVNTIELMPLGSFAGRRGWGYDGVAPFAPHAAYWRPEELCALIDEAHRVGLSVLLDVVYNHFGPDGNYLSAYSPEYFTPRRATPWGDAPDFGEPHLRQLVLDNASYWLERYRFDGLRLDATHAIVDDSPRHIVAELCDLVHGLPGPPVVFAEDERRGDFLVRDYHLDGFWADPFHHHVHVTLTGEREGYYAQYQPGAAALARRLEEDARSHTHLVPGAAGTSVPHTSPRLEQLVYCLENHDQVGNRALGERLSQLVALDAYLAASTLLLTLPATPLLFMGQEWAASAPFLYFTSHHAELGAAVSRGRREEFAGFSAFTDARARERIPDPQAHATLRRSTLDWDERAAEPHARVLAHYRRLLTLRRQDPVLSDLTHVELSAGAEGDVLWVERRGARGARLVLVNFGETAPLPMRPGFAAHDLIAGAAVRELERFGAVVLAEGEP